MPVYLLGSFFGGRNMFGRSQEREIEMEIDELFLT
jgi:hypothetical protein